MLKQALRLPARWGGWTLTLQALQVACRDADPGAGVDLIALDLFVEGLRHAVDFGSDGFNGRPQRGVLASVLQLTKRTARSRTSGENFCDLFMAPSRKCWSLLKTRGGSWWLFAGWQLKAGCCHSVSTAESKGGTATGRSPVMISNDRSTTWTGRSTGATDAKLGNGRSRYEQTGALDPNRASHRPD